MKVSMKMVAASSALAVGLGVSLAGCGTPSATNSTEPVIGADVSSLSIPYFKAAQLGIIDGGKKFHATIRMDNADNSATTQLKQVEDLIAQHVQALVINPVNSSAIVPAIEAANRAHIPVVLVDRGATGGNVYTTVESNNILLGEEAGKTIVNLLTKKFGSPKGNVVEIDGPLSTSSGLGRHDGLREELDKYKDIHIIATANGNYSDSGGYAAMSDILQAHPQISGPNAIDAVFGANDESSAGAAQAIQAAHRFYPPSSSNHIIQVSVDGSPIGVHELETGHVDAIVAQHPISMAEEAVHYALNAIHKKPSPGRVVYWPYVVVTPQNINSINLWGKRMSAS
ncbi:MAG: sugar ABC transporter substrate-binding protein [Sulfobacillus thermotolerans]|nr:sugar ABC transporter substrate-binding protein [Sulfobacillus thermotolerans]